MRNPKSNSLKGVLSPSYPLSVTAGDANFNVPSLYSYFKYKRKCYYCSKFFYTDTASYICPDCDMRGKGNRKPRLITEKNDTR
jgi:hypothetical protein